MDDAAGIPSSWAAQRRTVNRLRFLPATEARFRIDYEASATTSRRALLWLALVLIGLAPLYDAAILHPPAELVPTLRIIQFGFEIPLVLIAMLITNSRWRRWSVAATIVGTLAVGFGLIAQRVLAVPYGFHVPQDFPALVCAAAFVLGRFRFIVYFPWALLLVATATLADLMTFGAQSNIYYGLISSWMLFGVIAVGAYFLERGARLNWLQSNRLQQQALIDGLTGLPNRRCFDETFERLLRESARERSSISLLLLDIDDFKAYNDHYGHQAGDDCLRRVGHWLESTMRRPRDFCARVGGEEFAALWYDAQGPDAARLAEDLRTGIAALAIEHRAASAGTVVTASAGLAKLDVAPAGDVVAKLASSLLAQADAALYAAKRGGRNQLVIAGN
ncbi:MAG: diguanylate cyclase [Gammaproteobacteria bacterium]